MVNFMSSGVNKRKRNDRATSVDVAFVHASLFGEEQSDARMKYSTGEHNKEMGKTRQNRDKQDTHTLLFGPWSMILSV